MKPNAHSTEPVTEIVLRPGDFHFATSPTRIATLLGSCVSITLWHPRKRIGGMCHYMLTERPRQHDIALDGRYAAEAFALFLSEVDKAGTKPSEYQAKLFGGANMFKQDAGKLDIGARNIDFGRQLLASKHIPVMAEHVGGSGRRKLFFDVWSGEVWLAFPEGEGAQIRSLHG